MRRPVRAGLLFLVLLLVQQVGVGVMPCSTTGGVTAVAARPAGAHGMHHGTAGASRPADGHVGPAGHVHHAPAAPAGPATPGPDTQPPADPVPVPMPVCPGMLLCSAPAAPVPAVVALLAANDVEAMSAEGVGDSSAWPTRGRVAPEPPPPKG